MTKTIHNYFPGSNTALGFHSFFPQLALETGRIFILKGGPGTGKSTFLQRLAAYLYQGGSSLEQYWCSSDPQSLDGIRALDLHIALFDGTSPHILEPKYPGAKETLLDLGAFWCSEILEKQLQTITEMVRAKEEAYEKAYTHLKTSGIAIQTLRRERIATESLDEELEGLLPYIPAPGKGKPQQRQFFGTTITPRGWKNLLPEALADYRKTFVLPEDSGIDLHTLLQKLTREIQRRNHSCLLFYCGLLPHDLLAVALPQEHLAFCHPRPLPSREEVALGAAEECLKRAAAIHKELEALYQEAMDFQQVEHLCTQIQREIDRRRSLLLQG